MEVVIVPIIGMGVIERELAPPLVDSGRFGGELSHLAADIIPTIFPFGLPRPLSENVENARPHCTSFGHSDPLFLDFRKSDEQGRCTRRGRWYRTTTVVIAQVEHAGLAAELV